MILKIPFLAVLLYDMSPRLFPDNLVKGDDVGMPEVSHEIDLSVYLSTSCMVLESSAFTLLAM